MKSENNMLWGIIFGFIAGLVVSKVYQSWAILYRTEGKGYSGEDGWRDGLLSTPLWVRATDHPLGFTLIVMVIFVILGILFAKYISQNTNSESK